MAKKNLLITDLTMPVMDGISTFLRKPVKEVQLMTILQIVLGA